jgi:hypothetical protein
MCLPGTVEVPCRSDFHKRKSLFVAVVLLQQDMYLTVQTSLSAACNMHAAAHDNISESVH